MERSCSPADEAHAGVREVAAASAGRRLRRQRNSWSGIEAGSRGRGDALMRLGRGLMLLCTGSCWCRGEGMQRGYGRHHGGTAEVFGKFALPQRAAPTHTYQARSLPNRGFSLSLSQTTLTRPARNHTSTSWVLQQHTTTCSTLHHRQLSSLALPWPVRHGDHVTRRPASGRLPDATQSLLSVLGLRQA
jgi:hypothetical protein